MHASRFRITTRKRVFLNLSPSLNLPLYHHPIIPPNDEAASDASCVLIVVDFKPVIPTCSRNNRKKRTVLGRVAVRIVSLASSKNNSLYLK